MSETVQMKPVHPVATVLKHLRLIFGITALGTLILGSLIMVMFPPAYVADSGLEVKLLHSRVLVWDQEKQFSSRMQYTDFVNTQVNYMVSYENVMGALGRIEAGNPALLLGADDRETYFNFINMLRVEPVMDTHLISVVMESAEPRGLDKLVNALVDNYLDMVSRMAADENESRKTFLQEELERKRAELAEMQNRLADYTLELGTLNLNEEQNPHDQNLAFLRDALNRAYMRRVDAENDFNALISSSEAQRKLDVTPLVEEFVQQDMSTAEMRNLTFRVQEELSRQSSSLTPDHPSNKRLRQNAEASQEFLEQNLERSKDRAEDIFTGKMELEHQRDLAVAKASYEARLNAEQDIQNKYQTERGLLSKSIPIFLKARQLKNEIDRVGRRISEIDSRLEELSIEANESGRVKIQSRAREPLYPVKDRRKIFLALALIFCFGLSVVTAFGIDFLTPNIIDSQHMTQILGKPPTGVLAHWSKDQDYGQLLRTAPNAYQADQFRRIMTKLFANPAGDRPAPKIVTVLPLNQNSGASSFALNAMTHLENVGTRAGLLEVSPDPARLPQRTKDWTLEPASLAMDPQLARCFDTQVRSTGSGLNFYHFNKPYRRTDFYDVDLLSKYVNTLADANECLMLSSPPLLRDSEAELLCGFSDLVVLVVSGPQTSPGQLRRGLSLLDNLGVKQCAVIANNLPILPGGYFSKAKAAFEGKQLKYPLALDVVHSLKRAFPFLPTGPVENWLKGQRKDGSPPRDLIKA